MKGMLLVRDAGSVEMERDKTERERKMRVGGREGKKGRDVLVGKGIISSHSGVRYVSVLGFRIPSSKILLPTCELAFSTAERIFSIRSGAMKLAYPS